VSLEIDEGIQEDRKAYERRKKAVKVLLLGASDLLEHTIHARLWNTVVHAGQAESGKSTTLKSKSLLCHARRTSLSEHSQTSNLRSRPRTSATSASHGGLSSNST
jgi:hypothetical protein